MGDRVTVRGYQAGSRTWANTVSGRMIGFAPSVAPQGVLYPLQGSLVDAGPNGFSDLSVASGSERYTVHHPGVLGFHFDSQNALELAATGTALQTTGNVTFGALVRLYGATVPAATRYLLSYGGVGAGATHNVLYSARLTTSINVWTHQQGTQSSVSFGKNDYPPLYSGAPFAWVWRRSSNRVQEFINGAPFGSLSGVLAAAEGGSASRLVIGANRLLGEGWSGSMSHVWVQPSALTDAAIAQHCAIALGGVAL